MINGIVIIDKPEGITSAKTVLKIKKKFKLKKAGHAGTLDPFATGMLIVCLNRATKITQYLSNLDKVYIGTMVLGISTDTQDLKGKVAKIKSVIQPEINLKEIRKVFSKFKGELWQIPPMYSAVRYRGLRLYKLARKGISINLTPRRIRIYQLSIMRIRYDRYPSITFRVRCSKGTYIRTLCHDIGESLGVGAHLSHLRRIKTGHYTIGQSIPLDEFLTLPDREQLKRIVPFDLTLTHLSKIMLPENEIVLNKVKNGGWFSEKEIKEIVRKEHTALNNQFGVYSSEGYLLAIAERQKNSLNKENIFKVEKVFI